jgi:hypothetical protein
MLDEIIPDDIGIPEPGYARRVVWLFALALWAIAIGLTLGFVGDKRPSTGSQTTVIYQAPH